MIGELKKFSTHINKSKISYQTFKTFHPDRKPNVNNISILKIPNSYYSASNKGNSKLQFIGSLVYGNLAPHPHPQKYRQ